MTDKYFPGIGITAGSLMLKWNLLDTHIHQHHIPINPGDSVNLFINFETVLRNLTMQPNLVNLANFHKQKIVIELESAILNLMANYRMYLQKEKCSSNLYFYFTDLNEHPQEMEIYNKYYRDYYHNTYMKNPKFKLMGKILNEIIIPEISLILSYVPHCYFLTANTFDGSLIPRIVATFSDHKNVIITGDIFDTLYMFQPNFLTIYIKRRFKHFNVTSEIGETIRTIVKGESPFDLNLFHSEMYYRLLLSIKGSKIRNIRSAKGFGYGKFMNILQQGIKQDIILRDFQSLDSIIELFPKQYREDIKVAFQCTDLDTQYQLLNETDIAYINAQIIDKVDIESLEALNNQRFLEFPIHLQGLLN